MCEAGEREQKTCEQLVATLQANGRCTYHEDITTKLSNVIGRVNIILLIQSVLLMLVAIHLGWR